MPRGPEPDPARGAVSTAERPAPLPVQLSPRRSATCVTTGVLTAGTRLRQHAGRWPPSWQSRARSSSAPSTSCRRRAGCHDRRGAGTFVADVPARATRHRAQQSVVAGARHAAGAHLRSTPGRRSVDPAIDRRMAPGLARDGRRATARAAIPRPRGCPSCGRRWRPTSPGAGVVRAAQTSARSRRGRPTAWRLAARRASAREVVAIEDPGYRAAVAVAAHAGRDVVDVPVDDAGLDVAALSRLPRDDVAAVYVTPAHQHPLGVTLSAARRMALIAEARAARCRGGRGRLRLRVPL